MTIDEAIGRLRELNRPVPKPLSLPTEQDLVPIEQRLGVKFPADYREFMLRASDVVFGTLEPASITRKSYRYLPDLCETAWTVMGVPRHLLPICEDNGDYYCIDPSGKIIYWDHNGATDESWPNLATWIEQVWIEGG